MILNLAKIERDFEREEAAKRAKVRAWCERMHAARKLGMDRAAAQEFARETLR